VHVEKLLATKVAHTQRKKSNNWMTELSLKIATAKTQNTSYRFCWSVGQLLLCFFWLIVAVVAAHHQRPPIIHVRAPRPYPPRLTQFGRSERRCEDRETIRFALVHGSTDRSQYRCRKIWSDSTDTRPVTYETRNLSMTNCGIIYFVFKRNKPWL